jgi:hypothetical protein
VSESDIWKNDATIYGLTFTVGAPRSIPVAVFLDFATTVGPADVSWSFQRRLSTATLGVAYWR